MNLKFKEWLTNLDLAKPVFSDHEVASIYFHNHQMKVREIAEKTNKSIGEVYRILHRFGIPLIFLKHAVVQKVITKKDFGVRVGRETSGSNQDCKKDSEESNE